MLFSSLIGQIFHIRKDKLINSEAADRPILVFKRVFEKNALSWINKN